MREWGPGVFRPSRSMTVQDVNDLVELTHQPYMYRKQADWLKRHFYDLGEDPMVDDATKSNQEALSVLRFALQIVSVLSEKGPEEADEIVAFAEGVGNVEDSACYRGMTSLKFFSGEKASSFYGGTCNRWLDYRFRISGSYKATLWADCERLNASNEYFFFDCMVGMCFVDDRGEPIADLFNHKGECCCWIRVSDIFGDREHKGTDYMRCKALAALVDFLGTLHLCEVEVCVRGGQIAHQTNTRIAQAWRIAFEALNEVTARNDKYGRRKLKYKVVCCADCLSPRIVKSGKGVTRCPLCSNNNTKPHKSDRRRVY